MKKTILFQLFLACASYVAAQTSIGGNITSNQTWTKAGSPYLVTNNVYIAQGVKVTVMPGVKVIGGSNLSILIDGEFQVLGKKDTMVLLRKININYSTKAKDFNPSNSTGAYIRYAKVDSSTYGIEVNDASVKIVGCQFADNFYGIFGLGSGTDTSLIDVDSCKFWNTGTNGNSNRAFDVRMRSNDKLKVYNSDFYNVGYTYANCEIEIVKNNFNKVYALSMYALGHSIFSCNKVNNVNYKSTFDYGDYSDTTNSLDVEYNTFDTILSATYANYYAGIEFSKTMYYKGKLNVNYNNFLYCRSNIAKVSFYGGHTNNLTYESINMKNNYWVSTTTTGIAAMIKDWNDDVTLYANADYTNYKSSQISGCNVSTAPCKASYQIAVDTNQKYHVYLIENSTGVDSNTIFNWTFDTTHINNNRYPTYYHNGFGKIQVCLEIINNTTNCTSKFCDSVAVDSNGNYYASMSGYYINVMKWADFVNLNTRKAVAEKVNIYPNPSTGNVSIQLPSSFMGESVLKVYNMSGKVMLQKTISQQASYRWNTESWPAGYYVVELSSAHKKAINKLIVKK